MANPKFTAPKLYCNGEKVQDNSTKQTYQIPQHLADIIFKTLGKHNCSAQIRLMIVLIGTKQDGNFLVHENWLMDRTGLSKKSLSDARNALVEIGWITFEQYQGYTINYDVIYGKVNATSTNSTNKEPLVNTTSTMKVNSTSTLPVNATSTLKVDSTLTLIDKEQINITDKMIDKESAFPLIDTSKQEEKRKEDSVANRIASLCEDYNKSKEEIKIDGYIDRDIIARLLDNYREDNGYIYLNNGKIFKIK